MKLRRIGVLVVSLLLSGQCNTLLATEAEPDRGVKPMGDMRAVVESDSPTKDWGFAIGLKTWMNEWDLPISNRLENAAGTERSFAVYHLQSSTEVAFMPAFIARYKNFFVGGSFLPNTDYSFDTLNAHGQALYTQGVLVGVGEMVYDVEGEREEWDVNLGYLITPNLAVSLGYKIIEREYTFNTTFNSYYGVLANTSLPVSTTTTFSSNAPIIGLAASLPVGKNFNFYGNLAYGILGGDVDGNYYLGELGVDYTLPLEGYVSAVSFSGGYRFQRLDLDVGGGADSSDTTSGFTLGIRALF